MRLTKLNILQLGQRFTMSDVYLLWYISTILGALLIHLLDQLLDSKEHSSREIIHKISSMDTSNIKGSKCSLYMYFVIYNILKGQKTLEGKKPGHKTKHWSREHCPHSNVSTVLKCGQPKTNYCKPSVLKCLTL